MSVKQVVWSTAKVDEAKEKIYNGFIPPKKDSPYHENKIGLRKENVIFEMSNLEIDEYIKCYEDVMYFAENYCFVKSEDGKHKIIKLRPYQKSILKMYKENRFSILMAARQSGKTVSSAIYILHYLLFNNQKNVLITANKWDTNYDIVSKIKEIYSNLPYFLQKGIVIWNQKNFSFDNKSAVRTDIVSKAAGVGANIDMWYGDEFAIPEHRILEKFYTSVYPTISSMDNSKIILTSTPRGLNLFHQLLTDAERPDGDPLKNPFTSMRVYWYAVPSRFCTYLRLDKNRLHEYDITKEELLLYCQNKYGIKYEHAKGISGCEMVYDSGLGKYIIYIYNDDIVSEESIRNDQFKDRNFTDICEITTWKKEAIKGIGGEDAFNQEFGLQFVTSNRSLLDEKLIDDMQKGTKNFIKYEIDLFNQKLRFNWSDLKFVEDLDIFNPSNRKNYQVILSLDISEGLGNDYTVINIFKIAPKYQEYIDLYIDKFDKVSDFFMLQQIGMYRSNILSVAQLADLLYLISFEFFNPDNVKIVLELNYGGPELLAFLPHVFGGKNSYGTNIFFKYKHRENAENESIGLKVTASKNMMVKDYQDAMQRRDIMIYNEDNIRELTTFIKHETNAGNVQYKSDSSNDDCLLEDALIKTINGYTKIKDIEVGDLVLTHTGKYKKVIRKYIKEFDGDMYNIQFKSQLKLDISYNHPIYLYKDGSRVWETPKEQWNKDIKSISIIDELGDNINHVYNWYDLFEMNINSYLDNIKLKSIKLDKEFSKFLGIFLSDGNCSYNDKLKQYRISIYFNIKDVSNFNEVKSYLTSLGLNTYESIKNNCITISVNNITLYHLMEMCYDDDRNKVLPKYAKLLGKDLSYTLDWWLRGDGWFNKKTNTWIGASISKKLALDMRDIAFSIGKYATIQELKRKRYQKETKTQYWVSIKDGYNSQCNLKRMSNFEYGGGLRKIDKYKYTGLVYNLEVEDDNSYIANGIVVHNCTMTVVNVSTIFKKTYYHSMVDVIFRTCTKEFQDMVNKHLKNMDYSAGTDYSTFTSVARRIKGYTNNRNSGGLFGS